MGNSIRISKQYGVNPSVAYCQCCGKEYGVVMFGTGYKDKNGKTAEAPRDVAYGLCNDCHGVIDKGGLIIIEVQGKNKDGSPYRTGRLIAVSKEFKENNHIESPIVYMKNEIFGKLFKNVKFKKD